LKREEEREKGTKRKKEQERNEKSAKEKKNEWKRELRVNS
jgi:hypothetical protein